MSAPTHHTAPSPTTTASLASSWKAWKREQSSSAPGSPSPPGPPPSFLLPQYPASATQEHQQHDHTAHRHHHHQQHQQQEKKSAAEEEADRPLAQFLRQCSLIRARSTRSSSSSSRRGGSTAIAPQTSGTLWSMLTHSLHAAFTSPSTSPSWPWRWWGARWIRGAMRGWFGKNRDGDDHDNGEDDGDTVRLTHMELDVLRTMAARYENRKDFARLLHTLERAMVLARSQHRPRKSTGGTGGMHKAQSEKIALVLRALEEYLDTAHACTPLLGLQQRRHLRRLGSTMDGEAAAGQLLQMADEIMDGEVQNALILKATTMAKGSADTLGLQTVIDVERWVRQELHLAKCEKRPASWKTELRRRCIALRSLLREVYIACGNVQNALKYTEALWCEDEDEQLAQSMGSSDGDKDDHYTCRQRLDYGMLVRYAEENAACFVVAEPMVKCYEQQGLVPRIDCWVIKPQHGESKKKNGIYCPIPVTWAYSADAGKGLISKEGFLTTTGMNNEQFQEQILNVINSHLKTVGRSSFSNVIVACGNSIALRGRLHDSSAILSKRTAVIDRIWSTLNNWK